MPRSRSTAWRATRPRASPARGPRASGAAAPKGGAEGDRREERSAGSEQAPTAVRILEAVGSSTRSWDAAVTDAVRSAKDDAPDPIAVEVGRLWADLDPDRRIRRYRAAVKVAYRQRVTAPPREAGARSAPRKRTRTT